MTSSVRAGERPLDVWAEIPMALDPDRCAYQKETGFRAFVKEIKSKIGPLADECD